MGRDRQTDKQADTETEKGRQRKIDRLRETETERQIVRQRRGGIEREKNKEK